MRKAVFIAPHSDDEALFGSIIIQRYKPLVIIVTDSFVQYERGQHEITAHRRREESRAACRVMGVECLFSGLADDSFEHANNFILGRNPTLLFIPARQEGHFQHDLCNMAGHWYKACFETKLIEYSTYAAGQPYTPVKEFIELKPTEEEARIKQAVLDCYPSQHWQSHFKAINGTTSEWISRLP